MGNSVLEDFYLGAITPNERKLVKGSEAERLTSEKADVGSRLHEMLEDEALTLLERLEEAQSSLMGLIAEESYIDGFKTGARLMMEILDNSHKELEPVEE